MSMNSRTKQNILYGVAVITILAAVFAPPEQESVQPVRLAQQRWVKTQASDSSVKVVAKSSRLMPKNRSSLTDEPDDLFYVKKPPPPKVAKPEPPTAPPLPYVYMGKMIENGELTIFLTRNNKPYVVHSGDVLDNEYHVNAIRPPLVDFTYLPLQQVQVLNIGENK